MPCRDGGPSDQQIREERERLDRQARTACQAMAALERLGLLAEVDEEARQWWIAHKAEDTARIAQEERMKRERRERTEQKIAELKRSLEID